MDNLNTTMANSENCKQEIVILIHRYYNSFIDIILLFAYMFPVRLKTTKNKCGKQRNMVGDWLYISVLHLDQC